MTKREDKPTAGFARPARARLVTVDAESAERRLDNFLLTELKGLPRTRVYRLIRTGEVRVNKGRAKPSRRLEEGDVVRIPPVKGLAEDDSFAPDKERAIWINDRVLYEDDSLLLLDKPSGLAVHGGSGISLGAIELLRAARPSAHFMELVHRLDRDTSGCLLIAKKRSSLRRLHAEFRDGEVTKIYTALLMGKWQGGAREVTLPLLTEHRQNGERYVRVGKEGKPAETRFRPVEKYAQATLVSARLLTGRTHQIRVHSAEIGHPVAGDVRYGLQEKPGGLKRLFLHAAHLEFPHPVDGRLMSFDSSLDTELQGVLKLLHR